MQYNHGWTNELWSLNPFRKRAFDAAKINEMSITFEEYLNMFDESQKMKRGVFWLIEGELKCYPFDGSFPEGIAKSGNTYNHKKLWDHICPKGCNKAFDFYPRGRVEISSKGKAIVYMSPYIANDHISQICKEFKINDDPVVRYDHSEHYQCILVPDILEAIDDKCSIIVKKFTWRKDEEPAEEIIIPMQILISVQTGRRYIAGYVPKTLRFSTYRLDRIKLIKRNTVCSDYDRIKERYDVNIQRCFGVSFGDRREIGTVNAIKITFTIDERNESFIIDRLEREKRCAVLEKTGEGLYTLTADVFDPNEIMHWAKTFIGRIVSIEGGTQKVRMRFYNDIRRMYRMYGGIEDEHIQ